MNLSEFLKIFRFNIRAFIPEIFGLFITGLFTNFFLNLAYSPVHTFLLDIFHRDYDIFPLSFGIFQILAWIIFYLILRVLWTDFESFYSKLFPSEYGFNYVKSRSKKEKRINVLDSQRFLKDFIFQGNVKPVSGGLMITNSPAGCLIKPTPHLIGLCRKWTNFRARLEVEFPRQKDENFKDYIGIVFRAQNFDDYFMLEVCRIENDLLIRPHVRVNVNWDAPYLNPDFNIIKNYFTIKQITVFLDLEVIENSVVLLDLVTGKKLEWFLPSHVEANLLQTKNDNKYDLSKTYVGEIYFRSKAGMFGFRNYGNELAFIKSLYISNL